MAESRALFSVALISSGARRMINVLPQNVLHKCLPELPPITEIRARRIVIPEVPLDIGAIARPHRRQYLMRVRDLHVPSDIEPRFVEAYDLSLRESLNYQNPASAATWQVLSGECKVKMPPMPRQGLCMAIEGGPGYGKSRLYDYTSQFYPYIAELASVPGMVGPVLQVLQVSVQVPPSGKAADLAIELGRVWDEMTGGGRFEHWRESGKKFPAADGGRMLNEVLQVFRSHFLGMLHLDDVHNFFRLAPLQQRSRGKRDEDDLPQLSIVEDSALRWLDMVINSGRPAMVVSGTSDGIRALCARFGTIQRMTSMGHFMLEEFRLPSDTGCKSFFDGLAKAQYVAEPLVMSDDAIRRIIELTAGVRRIIVSLWIIAHQIAWARPKGDALGMRDIEVAAATALAPLQPAIDALRRRDRNAARKYADLLPASFSWPEITIGAGS